MTAIPQTKTAILHQELLALKAENASLSATGPASPIQLTQQAQILERYRTWCRRALAETHLVTTAALVRQILQVDLAGMEALGLPVDWLAQFPDWETGSQRGFRSHSPGLTLAPAGAGYPINALRLQLSPASATIPYALMLLRDLLDHLDPAVQFKVVVEPGADFEGLYDLIGQFGAAAAGRVTFVPLSIITLFAQDNARAARDGQGQPVLMLPRAFRRGGARAEDELSATEAAQVFEITVAESRLYWEGGNVIHDAERCFIGVDTIVENMARLGLTKDQVLASFQAEFGAEVIPLGDLAQAQFDPVSEKLVKSGQTSFHIDLDVSLLGRFGRKRRSQALIADPARGLELLPQVLNHEALFTNQFLPPEQAKELIAAEYDAYAHDRHPRLLAYAETLEKAGYRVIGVPDLRIDPKENLFGTVNLDFSYCNSLPGLNRGRPAVHYLPWGIPQFDQAAEACYRQAGVEPVRISTTPHIANALMQLYGGLHCFCGQLA